MIRGLLIATLLLLQGGMGPGPGTPHLVSSPIIGYFTLAETLGTPRNNADGWVGMIFTTPSSAPPTALRLCRANISGNSQTHPVELFDNTSGTVVATASIDTTLGTPGTKQCVSISSTLLTASHQYAAMSCEFNGGDSWYDDDSVKTSVNPSYGTLNGSAYSLGSGCSAITSVTAHLSSPHAYVTTDVGFIYVAPPPVNLVAYWNAIEGSGLTIHDSVASNDIVAPSGSIIWSNYSGALTQSVPDLQVVGNRSICATTSTATDFTNTTPLTLFAWIYFPTTTGYEQIMDNRTNVGGNQGYTIALTPDPLFYIKTVGSGAIQAQGTSSLSAGLHLIMGTYDGSTNGTGIHVYADGTLVGTGTGTGNVSSSFLSGEPICMGNGYDNGGTIGNAVFSAGVANIDESANAASLYANGPFVQPAW